MALIYVVGVNVAAAAAATASVDVNLFGGISFSSSESPLPFDKIYSLSQQHAKSEWNRTSVTITVCGIIPASVGYAILTWKPNSPYLEYF